MEKIMLKKYTALMLIGLIINLAFGSFVFAQDAETKAAEKIKIKIANWASVENNSSKIE